MLPAKVKTQCNESELYVNQKQRHLTRVWTYGWRGWENVAWQTSGLRTTHQKDECLHWSDFGLLASYISPCQCRVETSAGVPPPLKSGRIIFFFFFYEKGRVLSCWTSKTAWPGNKQRNSDGSWEVRSKGFNFLKWLFWLFALVCIAKLSEQTALAFTEVGTNLECFVILSMTI